MNVTVQTELADVLTSNKVKHFFLMFINKAECLTWHALAVMSDGVSGENAGLRAAPT